MDTCSASFLGKTDDGSGDAAPGSFCLGAAAACHGKVGVLVHHHHKVGEETVPLIAAQVVLLELFVVERNLVHACLGQQFVTLVHLDANRAQDLFGVLWFLDDGGAHLVFFRYRLGHHGQIVVKELGIGGEFHHLGIDEYEFEFRRMAAVKQRTDYHVEAY